MSTHHTHFRPAFALRHLARGLASALFFVVLSASLALATGVAWGQSCLSL